MLVKLNSNVVIDMDSCGSDGALPTGRRAWQGQIRLSRGVEWMIKDKSGYKPWYWTEWSRPSSLMTIGKGKLTLWGY